MAEEFDLWGQPEEQEFVRNIEATLRNWVAHRRPDENVPSLVAAKPMIDASFHLLEVAYADKPEHLDQLREDIARLYAGLSEE